MHRPAQRALQPAAPSCALFLQAGESPATRARCPASGEVHSHFLVLGGGVFPWAVLAPGPWSGGAGAGLTGRCLAARPRCLFGFLSTPVALFSLGGQHSLCGSMGSWGRARSGGPPRPKAHLVAAAGNVPEAALQVVDLGGTSGSWLSSVDGQVARSSFFSSLTCEL